MSNNFSKKATTHPLYGKEIYELRTVAKRYLETPYAFVSERRDPLADSTFRKVVARTGVAAQLGLTAHLYMLRHATGFKFANDGQETRAIRHSLGHKNIQHTVAYTTLAATRFQGFWDD